jgi:PadR family transcriptional regulator
MRPYKRNALIVPDVFQERIFSSAARVEFFPGQNRIAYFAPQLPLDFAHGFRYCFAARSADHENIDVARGILLVASEGTVQISLLNAVNFLEGLRNQRRRANGVRQRKLDERVTYSTDRCKLTNGAQFEWPFRLIAARGKRLRAGQQRRTPIIRLARKSISACLPRVEVLVSVTEGIKMSKPSDLVQGTLDMLLLKILALEPMNGFAVSQRLKQVSGDVLQVSDGSLYPALHKLEQEGWITAEWKTSEYGRRAKYYSLTRLGRRQLEKEADNWGRLSSAISRVIKIKEA